MALSDVERKKDKPSPNRQVNAGTNKQWGDKQKLEACQTYLVLGNIAMTSRITGIPEITLRVWKTSEWWKTLVEELRVQEKVELSNKLKRIVNAAHTVVEQRLTQGDPFINPKTGEVDYKPVALRDAHRVAVDLQNQQLVVEKASNSTELTAEDGNSNQLEKLAEKFAEFATKKIEQKMDERRTVDVPYVEIIEEKEHAVHEERKAGLQEGVREVSLSSGTNQESDGTDDSSPSS